MKVLLILPWTKTLFGDERATPGHPHVGVAYLSAVLKKAGHKVKIFDQAIEKNDHKLKPLIKEFKPDLIGISAFSYCYRYAFELIDFIKGFTKIPLMVGGPHVSAVKIKVLEKTRADFAMKGEAEESLLVFLKELERKNPNLEKVPNLIWRGENGEIIENQNMPLIENLDSLPFPDYSEFGFSKYSYYETRTIPIITSRGCPYGCNYCSVALSMGRGFRARSPKNVVDEIKHWYEQGFVNFEINDDCFTLDIKRAMVICDLIIESGMKISYQLYNGIRVDKVTKELLEKMKLSGCIFISYGAESGSQDIINVIGKGITLDQIKRAVVLTNNVGIKNSVNFIIGHPTETYQKAMQTLEFAGRLPTNFVNVYNVIPYPGTKLFDWIEKNGQRIYHPDYVLENIGSRDPRPVFETREFSEKERIAVLKKGFALYEKTVLQFRFGRSFGKIVYILTRNRSIFNTGVRIALGTKLGFKIYSFVTSRSKTR